MQLSVWRSTAICQWRRRRTEKQEGLLLAHRGGSIAAVDVALLLARTPTCPSRCCQS
jgi:hypothetical protein